MWLSRVLQPVGAWPMGGSGSSCACADPCSLPGAPASLSATVVAEYVEETPPPEAVPGSGSGRWLARVGTACAALLYSSSSGSGGRGLKECGSGFSVSDSPGTVRWGPGAGLLEWMSEMWLSGGPVWALHMPQCFYFLEKVGGNIDNIPWCSFIRPDSCWELNDFGVGLTNFTIISLWLWTGSSLPSFCSLQNTTGDTDQPH